MRTPALPGDLAAALGDNLRSAVFFGSRLTGAGPGAHSAADVFFVVDDCARFYRDLGSRVPGPRRLMAWLNHLLPPNVIYLSTPGNAGIKVFVIQWRDFRRAMGPRARDHFCQGRLSQQVRVVHARDAATRATVEELLEGARLRTLEWVPVYARAPFSVSAYCLAMLETSYHGEVRPESPDRVNEVFEAQRDELITLYEAVLAAGLTTGRLIRHGDACAPARPIGRRERRRWRWYFARSKARATLRWAKYVITFAGWPEYIARKLERRTGMRIELTERERRWPLLFAWPRAIRTLLVLRRQRQQASARGKQP